MERQTVNAEQILRLREIGVESIEALELAPLGSPWAPLDAHAAASVEALKAARLAFFPTTIGAVAPAVLAHFEFMQAHHPFETFEAFLVDVHRRSADTFPELATFARSPEVRQRALAFAQVRARYAGASNAAAEAERAVGAMEAAIAGHLVGRAEFEPAASVLAVDVPALLERLAAARHRHEEFARAEAERLAGELRAAEQAIADADRARREELARFFGTRASRAFTLDSGRVVSGAGLAAWVSDGTMRDLIDGHVAITTIAEIERLRLETEAAEAARHAGAGVSA